MEQNLAGTGQATSTARLRGSQRQAQGPARGPHGIPKLSLGFPLATQQPRLLRS